MQYYDQNELILIPGHRLRTDPRFGTRNGNDHAHRRDRHGRQHGATDHLR